LKVNKKDIEHYLSEVKHSVESGNYRIDLNSRRLSNISLFSDYIIDESKVKKIIMSLTVMDFSHILKNEHKGYIRLNILSDDLTENWR